MKEICARLYLLSKSRPSDYLEDLLFYLLSPGVLAACAAEDPTREIVSGMYRYNRVS